MYEFTTDPFDTTVVNQGFLIESALDTAITNKKTEIQKIIDKSKSDAVLQAGKVFEQWVKEWETVVPPPLSYSVVTYIQQSTPADPQNPSAPPTISYTKQAGTVVSGLTSDNQKRYQKTFYLAILTKFLEAFNNYNLILNIKFSKDEAFKQTANEFASNIGALKDGMSLFYSYYNGENCPFFISLNKEWMPEETLVDKLFDQNKTLTNLLKRTSNSFTTVLNFPLKTSANAKALPATSTTAVTCIVPSGTDIADDAVPAITALGGTTGQFSTLFDINELNKKAKVLVAQLSEGEQERTNETWVSGQDYPIGKVLLETKDDFDMYYRRSKKPTDTKAPILDLQPSKNAKDWQGLYIGLKRIQNYINAGVQPQPLQASADGDDGKSGINKLILIKFKFLPVMEFLELDLFPYKKYRSKYPNP